jgi:hypothetical protein
VKTTAAAGHGRHGQRRHSVAARREHGGAGAAGPERGHWGGASVVVASFNVGVLGSRRNVVETGNDGVAAGVRADVADEEAFGVDEGDHS